MTSGRVTFGTICRILSRVALTISITKPILLLSFKHRTLRSLFRLLRLAFIAIKVCSTCNSQEMLTFRDAKINGISVQLIFDSGSYDSALFLSAMRRLKLSIASDATNVPSTAGIIGETEDCSAEICGTLIRTRFVVLELPSYAHLRADGLVGWWPMSANLMKIDAARGELTFLSNRLAEAREWTGFPIDTNWGSLVINVPHGKDSDGHVFIDTGIDWGLALPPRKWQQWRAAHPKAPLTFRPFFTPSDGFVVQPEAWAENISIGSIVLKGVPIIEATPAAVTRWGDEFEGVMGMAALAQLELFIDGEKSTLYCNPKVAAYTKYPHNRLGAVFVPTVTKTNQAVARVAAGSAAYEAGVRDGDVLLKVDGIPVVGWTSDWNDRFLMPAGTKLHLELERGEKIFETVATLRQIIPPESSTKP